MFYNYKEVSSPRIHDNLCYQQSIKSRLMQLATSKFFKQSTLLSKSLDQTREYRSRNGFQRSVTNQIDSVCISEDVQVINHRDPKPKGGMIKTQQTLNQPMTPDPTTMSKFSLMFKRRRSQIGARGVPNNNLRNIQNVPDAEEKRVDKELGDNLNEYDFILSNF